MIVDGLCEPANKNRGRASARTLPLMNVGRQLNHSRKSFGKTLGSRATVSAGVVWARCAFLRVVETVVLGNHVFGPCRRRGPAPQTPEIDENDQNGGCHLGKITVCQKHRFDNPSFKHKQLPF